MPATCLSALSSLRPGTARTAPAVPLPRWRRTAIRQAAAAASGNGGFGRWKARVQSGV